MTASLIETMLVPSGEPVEMELADEKCGECQNPVGDGTDEVVGLIGEDAQGLPGWVLFHDICLGNRLLRFL